MLHAHGGIGWDMKCSNMPKQSETTMVGMREAMRCSGSNVSPEHETRHAQKLSQTESVDMKREGFRT